MVQFLALDRANSFCSVQKGLQRFTHGQIQKINDCWILSHKRDILIFRSYPPTFTPNGINLSLCSIYLFIFICEERRDFL